MRLIDLVLKFRDRPWHWYSLSANPNITYQDVIDYPDLPWNWSGLSSNTSVATLHNISENPSRPWNWNIIAQNPNVSLKFIVDNPDKWNYWYLSYNPNITLQYVLSHLDKNWSWHGLSKHLNITSEIVRSTPNLPWSWDGLAQNPNFDIKELSNLPGFESDRYSIFYLSHNPNLTMRDILENLNKIKKSGFDWYAVSFNTNITFKDVINNPDHPWNWNSIFRKKNTTIQNILSLQIIRTHKVDVLRNPNITLQEALDMFPDPNDTQLVFERLSNNPNITLQDVATHADKPWNWILLSANLYGYKDVRKMDPKLQREIQLAKTEKQCRPYGEMYYTAQKSFLGHINQIETS